MGLNNRLVTKTRHLPFLLGDHHNESLKARRRRSALNGQQGPDQLSTKGLGRQRRGLTKLMNKFLRFVSKV